MSTLGTKYLKTNKGLLKTWIIFLLITIGCIIFDRVYAIFSFGVFSLSMDWMFLYPLLLGCLPYFILWIFSPTDNSGSFYKVSSNAINTGIAILTVGAALQGVVDIAGRTTSMLQYFPYAGWGCFIIGFLGFVIQFVRAHKRAKQ